MNAILDPISIELVRRALESLSDDMAITIMRTARSGNAKEQLDFSTGILNERGELLAAGLGRPLHLGMVHVVMKAVMDRYPIDEMSRGDMFILNDPYEGGTHLPDIYLIKPVFFEGGCIGFTADCLHHTDIGGRVPGGNASDSTEIYQEGLRLPPLKLFDRGEPNEAIFRILEKNVRLPEQSLGDLNSQISGCRIGEAGLVDLVASHGLDKYTQLTEALLDYSERLARVEIQGFPNGVYEFIDHIDDDGMGSGPIRIQVGLIVEDDAITVDFTGTSPQVKGSINPVLGHTYLTTVQALLSAFSSNQPVNAGYFRAVEVIAPPGSFVNPLPPAGVAARGLSMMRIEDVVWGALAKMLPDRIFACSAGLDSGFTFAGVRPDGRPFVYLEFLQASWGGRPFADGIDALTRPSFTFGNTPAEVIEVEQPLMIDEYSIAEGTGGPGRHRGGMGLNRVYRLLDADECMVQLRSDRRQFLPYGLAGGREGTPSNSTLNPGPDQEDVPPKGQITLKRGDVFSHTTAGAGGWGPPWERDPGLVLEDVRGEKMTVEYAEREYGVVIDPATMAVDEEATTQARRKMSGA